VRKRQGERLDEWIKTVREVDIAELCRFAAGLTSDCEAVKAGLTEIWSNGQTEGHVHRLKFVKRSMYGRANFDLLRQRVLHAA
jgi:transposase